MRWFTHVLGGTGSLWLLAVIPSGLPSLGMLGSGATGLSLATAMLGALAPDLDAGESKIKNLKVGSIRPFHALATVLNAALGHRALLHSLGGLGLATLTVGVPVALFLGWQPALAFLLGYASHIALDACTIRGLPLRYPNPKRFHLLPPSWRVRPCSFRWNRAFMCRRTGSCGWRRGRCRF